MQGLRPEQLQAGDKYEWKYIAFDGSLCYNKGVFLRVEKDSDSIPGETCYWLWFRFTEHGHAGIYDAPIDWDERMIITLGVE